MKKAISLGLISALSLTILGGMTALAYEDAGSAQRPPAAHKAEKPGKAREKPAPREAGQTYEPGLTPPLLPGDHRSSRDQQEHLLKEATELGLTTVGISIEDLKKTVHQKKLEAIANLLKSAAAEANISTDDRSLEEIQHLLKAYYYAKMEALGIVMEGRKPAPRPELAPAAPASENTSPGTTNSSNSENAATSVVISGGFNTDPQDNGRPVVLIAAALGVPTEVFREAFRGVTPAGADSGPSSALAQRNKAALLNVLAPYGITNDRLDEVSNYYRYNQSKGETWPKIQASATATVTNGVVTGITITNPGAGYSSIPTVTVIGLNGQVSATAAISYTAGFRTNGSLSAITIQ